jgi:hypothetical protein
MRELKIFVMMIASLVLTVFLGLAGCSQDHKSAANTGQNQVAAEPRFDDTDDNAYITDPGANQHGDLHEGPGFDSGRDRDASQW